MTPLRALSLCHKVSITGFLAVCTLGLGASAWLYAATAGPPSIRALISPQAAWIRRHASPLERALRTTMRQYLQEPSDVELIAPWVETGSPRRGYYETIRPILQRDCFTCHGKVPAGGGATSLYTYADVLPYAITRGAPLQKVAVRAHAHLFGVGLVLLVLALLVSATAAPQRWRVAVSAALFLALIGDVLGQYLAKLHGVFAYLTWLSGWGLVGSFTIALGLIMQELWFRERAGRS